MDFEDPQMEISFCSSFSLSHNYNIGYKNIYYHIKIILAIWSADGKYLFKDCPFIQQSFKVFWVFLSSFSTDR